MSEPRPDAEHVHEWFEDTSGGEWCYDCGVTRDRLAGTSSDTPDTGAGTPLGLLARWPEADLFAALDAEGWFRGMDTKDATEATAKVYARLARSRPATDPAGLDALREVQQAVADVRMAADSNGHGWVTRTDAWTRLEAAARLSEDRLR